MKNNLPKYWMVKRDSNHPLWHKVVQYITEQSNYKDWTWSNKYYGKSNSNFYSGYTGSHDLIDICQLITIEQFREMTEGKFKKGDDVLVSDNGEKWLRGKFISYNRDPIYLYQVNVDGYSDILWKYCKHADMEEEWIPEFGEIVEFSADGNVWVERIFLGILPKLNRKYIAVQYLSEESFKKNGNYAVSVWAYARKIQEPEPLNVTIEDIAKKFGVDPKQIHIIDK